MSKRLLCIAIGVRKQLGETVKDIIISGIEQ